MKNEDILITALDIGASKVCCLISALPDSKGAMNILGYGLCHHDCLKKGIVTDIKNLSEAVSQAVSKAEQISKKKVQSVFCNISGSHLKGVLSRGEVIISDRDNEITRHDIDRVIANAKAVHMPYERDIIYSSREDFIVDSEAGITNPAGMFGIKLEADMFIITAKMPVVDNLKKAVRYAGLSIEDLIVSAIAGQAAVLSSHEKDLGVVFLDIGADLTDVLIYRKSRPVFFKTLALGGDTITQNLARKLSISEADAERLKIKNLNLDLSDSGNESTAFLSENKKKVSFKEIKEILSGEYLSAFQSIRKEIRSSGYANDIPAGIVICGQSAVIDGCIELAERAFSVPVRIAHIMGMGFAPKPLPSHIYFTAAGLLRCGIESRLNKMSILKLGPKNWISALWEYARRLYKDYF
jgi:cell division protein FtsA